MIVALSLAMSTILHTAAQQPRIINGEAAVLGQFPHQVDFIVFYTGSSTSFEHFCGGSLIALDTVLTAGHCMESDYMNYRVVSGVTDIRSITGDTDPRVRKVVSAAKHTNYSTNQFSIVNDIALFNLNQPFTESAYIKSVILPSDASLYEVGTHSVISGFGSTTYLGIQSTYLLSTVVIVKPREDAVVYQYTGSRNWHDGWIIAGDPGYDSCQGDSGGALVVKPKSGAAVQIGVASFGSGCGESSGVYTSILYHKNWIASKSRGSLIFTGRQEESDLNGSSTSFPAPIPPVPTPNTQHPPSERKTSQAPVAVTPAGFGVSSVSTETLSYEGRNTVDGSLDTEWRPLSSDLLPMICFSLSRKASVSQVTIYWGTATRGMCQIWVADDKSKLVKVASIDSFDSNVPSEVSVSTGYSTKVFVFIPQGTSIKEILISVSAPMARGASAIARLTASDKGLLPDGFQQGSLNFVDQVYSVDSNYTCNSTSMTITKRGINIASGVWAVASNTTDEIQYKTATKSHGSLILSYKKMRSCSVAVKMGQTDSVYMAVWGTNINEMFMVNSANVANNGEYTFQMRGVHSDGIQITFYNIANMVRIESVMVTGGLVDPAWPIENTTFTAVQAFKDVVLQSVSQGEGGLQSEKNLIAIVAICAASAVLAAGGLGAMAFFLWKRFSQPKRSGSAGDWSSAKQDYSDSYPRSTSQMYHDQSIYDN